LRFAGVTDCQEQVAPRLHLRISEVEAGEMLAGGQDAFALRFGLVDGLARLVPELNPDLGRTNSRRAVIGQIGNNDLPPLFSAALPAP
jgi:hypothetical protein